MAMQANTIPKYTITPKIAIALMRIEASKGKFLTFEAKENPEEPKGYVNALNKAKGWAVNGSTISEKMIPTLHALMMADGLTKIKPSNYRQGTFPDVPDVTEIPAMIKSLVDWINQNTDLPCPLVAAIAYFQCFSIQPFEEGNSYFAKLLSTLILHMGGYYADFSFCKTTDDITKSVEEYVEAVALSYEITKKEVKPSGEVDKKDLIRELNLRQRKALKLFKGFATVSASQIGEQFDLKPRTRAQLCKDWVDSGFLEVVDNSNKARKYKLQSKFEALI
jgi:hypothetical protein